MRLGFLWSIWSIKVLRPELSLLSSVNNLWATHSKHGCWSARSGYAASVEAAGRCF